MHKRLKLTAAIIIGCNATPDLIGNAQATSASASVTIVMTVVAPACTIAATSGSIITLPSATPDQTLRNYTSANGLTADSISGAAFGYVTSSALNQTATITCNAANTPIASVLVAPAEPATVEPGHTNKAWMTDSAGNKLGGGTLFKVTYEQVSINGTAAPFRYWQGSSMSTSPRAYATTFWTGPLVNGGSTARVVWRPTFEINNSPGGTSQAFGTPIGGTYSTPAMITVNY